MNFDKEYKSRKFFFFFLGGWGGGGGGGGGGGYECEHESCHIFIHDTSSQPCLQNCSFMKIILTVFNIEGIAA